MGKSRRSARVASSPALRSASTVSRASLRWIESSRALPARTRIFGFICLAFKIYDVEGLFWIQTEIGASDTMRIPPFSMALRFYNTLSQQVEVFSPASDNTVRMYTCGPTVYDFPH